MSGSQDAPKITNKHIKQSDGRYDTGDIKIYKEYDHQYDDDSKYKNEVNIKFKDLVFQFNITCNIIFDDNEDKWNRSEIQKEQLEDEMFNNQMNPRTDYFTGDYKIHADKMHDFAEKLVSSQKELVNGIKMHDKRGEYRTLYKTIKEFIDSLTVDVTYRFHEITTDTEGYTIIEVQEIPVTIKVIKKTPGIGLYSGGMHLLEREVKKWIKANPKEAKKYIKNNANDFDVECTEWER